VKVKLDVSTTTEREISGLELKPEGLDEEYEVSIITPKDGAVDATLKGENGAIDAITKDDFNLALDLTGLEPGEHEVEINAEGPENVDWTLSEQTVKIQIKEKNTSA
jgi:YbbR domain-containing protein